MSTALVVHRGARYVDRDELRAIPAPPATPTWYPLAHHVVLDRVLETLGQAGFQSRAVTLALSQDNAKFFATVDLDTPVTTGVSLSVGVRNSVDKSLPIGFVAGHRVFVCDNLAFRSDLLNVSRKHTRFGEVRYQEAIAKAVQGLGEFREAEAARVIRFTQTEITQERAESMMLRAYEQDVVSHYLLPQVIGEWRKPSFQEFEPRTLWSLFNSFTTVLAPVAKRNPQRFASLTMKLQHLLDAQTGGIIAP
jgi:hypothetical protein